MEFTNKIKQIFNPNSLNEEWKDTEVQIKTKDAEVIETDSEIDSKSYKSTDSKRLKLSKRERFKIRHSVAIARGEDIVNRDEEEEWSSLEEDPDFDQNKNIETDHRLKLHETDTIDLFEAITKIELKGTILKRELNKREVQIRDKTSIGIQTELNIVDTLRHSATTQTMHPNTVSIAINVESALSINQPTKTDAEIGEMSQQAVKFIEGIFYLEKNFAKYKILHATPKKYDDGMIVKVETAAESSFKSLWSFKAQEHFAIRKVAINPQRNNIIATFEEAIHHDKVDESLIIRIWNLHFAQSPQKINATLRVREVLHFFFPIMTPNLLVITTTGGNLLTVNLSNQESVRSIKFSRSITGFKCTEFSSNIYVSTMLGFIHELNLKSKSIEIIHTFKAKLNILPADGSIQAEKDIIYRPGITTFDVVHVNNESTILVYGTTDFTIHSRVFNIRSNRYLEEMTDKKSKDQNGIILNVRIRGDVILSLGSDQRLIMWDLVNITQLTYLTMVSVETMTAQMTSLRLENVCGNEQTPLLIGKTMIEFWKVNRNEKLKLNQLNQQNEITDMDVGKNILIISEQNKFVVYHERKMSETRSALRTAKSTTSSNQMKR